MDVGVGAFVFANALVCRQARGCVNRSRPLRMLKDAAQSVLPLLLIGGIRFVVLRFINYQVWVFIQGQTRCTTSQLPR